MTATLHYPTPNPSRRRFDPKYPLVKHRAGRCPRLRHSAGKNTRLKRQVSQLRHTVTTLRISKAASNDSGGEPPYSAFKVVSVKWGAGTDEDPYIIELVAAPDNKAEPEDLVSAPWS